MSDRSGYSTTGNATGPVSSAGAKDEAAYWDIGKLKKAFSDYLGSKNDEINEAKEARRYYHGAQWTDAQIKILKKRKQPIATINRIGRKIDGVVGLLEKMRQDPKAYPRTPKQEQGAELATAVIRYALDQQDWQPKSAEVARDGAIEGIAGIEVNLVQGDTQDPNDKDIEFDIVEPDSFFYDPRSYRSDFSDAQYMGVGKWMTAEQAKELLPGKDDLIDGSIEDSTELTTNPDRDNKWVTSDRKYIRLVDCWYRHQGKWCWAIFTGSQILMEGESYLMDEKNKTECKYIMYSGNVDHDGDRYGFVRNMKSQQDGINFKESKLHHILGSRRLILTQGSVDDVEKTRAEWARPDGIVVVNPGGEAKADDQTFDFAGWSKLLQDAKEEIENFGPNPAVLGQGVEKQSGRAISLLQQAGIAELGPYIISYRGWKIRVYRAIFNALQHHWTGERWIRVTDDDSIAQFIQINGMGIDPMTGHPTVVNALGSLDVDITIDEGPDTINAQQDVYETLSNVLPTVGQMLLPQEARAAVGVLLEASALPASAKKKFRDASQQAAQQPPPPNPEIEKAKAQLAAKQAENAQQLEFEKQKAGTDMALKQQQHEQDLAQKREQSLLDAQLEREKMAMQYDHERLKLGAHVESEREKANINREMQRDSIEGEAKKVTESKRDPSQEKIAAAISEMASGIVQMADGMSTMAESIEDMGEKIAAPKRIIRDSAGNIIGAESAMERA